MASLKSVLETVRQRIALQAELDRKEKERLEKMQNPTEFVDEEDLHEDLDLYEFDSDDEDREDSCCGNVGTNACFCEPLQSMIQEVKDLGFSHELDLLREHWQIDETKLRTRFPLDMSSQLSRPSLQIHQQLLTLQEASSRTQVFRAADQLQLVSVEA